MSRSNNKKIYNYLIVGGGPAGLQLGYYMQQANQDYIILEQGKQAGTFMAKFPRHGMLISINKVHTGYTDPEINMRWDWNSLLTDDYSLLFKDYSQEYYPSNQDLIRYFRDFVKKYNININFQTEVYNISKDNNGIFTIKTNSEIFYCKNLIVASGISKPYIPDIQGIELVTQYYDLDISKERLINKRVLIIGKGNSGFETANHLTDTASLIHIISPEPLKFAFNSRYPGHLRSINSVFMDTYLLKAQNGILNAKIEKIEKGNFKGRNGLNVTVHYSNAHDEVETMFYDEVISCAGFKFNSEIFDKSAQPELCIDNRFPAMTSYYESTTVENLYFTGNLTQSLDFKQKQSAFIHGFRYNAQFLAKYLLAINNNKTMVEESITANTNNLTNHIIKLINRNSAMWQQTGYMSCAYVFDPQNKVVEFISNVPTRYIKQANFIQNKFCVLVCLDFGDMIKKPGFNALTHNRVHKENHEQAYDSSVIHPIVTLLYSGEEVAKHHIIEDFENEWMEEVHVNPLQKFIKQCFDYIGSDSKSKSKV